MSLASLPYELFLASRYLRSRRGRRLARVTALAAFGGIAVGVAALIIAIALANGFRDELRAKILRGTAHISAARRDNSGTADDGALSRRLSGVAGVTAVSLTTYDGALLAGADDNAAYAVLRGVDGHAPHAVEELRPLVVHGDLASLFTRREESSANKNADEVDVLGLEGDDDEPLPSVAVGAELAARANLHVGDVARLISAGAALASPDQVPASRRVRVAAIIRSGLYEYDATWIYVSLATAAELAGGRPAGAVVNIETDDPDRAEVIAERVRAALGERYTVIDWRTANRPLFAALALERRVIMTIIALIVLVAALNITTSLGLIVTERRADIAVLGALGARPSSIMLIFLCEGAVLGLAGALAGVALGLLASFLGNYFQVISLPADVYSISHVPFHPSARDTALAALVAFAVSVLATIYPARAAARLRPAEALRYE